MLVRALAACEYELFAVGRRAEGLAMCEEMEEARRSSSAQGLLGHHRLAVALAEGGRHLEAAEICGREVQDERSAGPRRDSFWTVVPWAAELDAAGRHDAALEVFAELVDTTRGELDASATSLAILTWSLVHQSRMLDTAGRCAEAREARKEALVLLTELGETGERKTWSNTLSWWTTLFALSGRSAEPAGTPTEPAPSFGSAFHHWSPDVKEAYLDGLATLEQETTALTAAARTDPHGHLAELAAVHRRLTIRSACCRAERGHRIPTELRPVFDEGVALARRLADLAAPGRGREALAGALTDRSMYLVAAQQYGEAYEDFVQVVALLD
ncbi:hypothetical protein ACIPSA_44595 [Streptomyces sp. NPDC086549]|uniref:hypothetical protein n=1 Tax=Streptomyces sp. NPDC086549 TaxID=3365752 RepID=UPI003830DC39